MIKNPHFSARQGDPVMIDMEHLNSISLSSNPIGQRIVARFILGPNYHLFQNVDIRLENLEKIPRDETVIFAMNHTAWKHM